MKNSIAVIRALDVRLIQAEYASSFKKLKSVFISNFDREISDFAQKTNLKYIPLPLTPSLFFDPASLFFDKPVNKSWLVFKKEDLEQVVKKVDFLQIQEPYFIYSGQVAEMAKKLRKALICAPWTSFLHLSTFLPPYSFSVRKVIKQTDFFIVRSKKCEEDYLSYFKIPDRKKVLIYHGINIKRFYPRKALSDNIRILFSGQLTAHKGINDLLDIFPKLVKYSKKPIELIISGKGQFEGRIKEMSKSLPIEYLGYVSSSRMPGIYRRADIFCGPSKDWYSLGIKRTEEGFGFVFLEAMASGLPVVTNDCGAIKEVVGDNNYLNKQGDKKALYSSLIELINDSNMRRDIGVKNRRRVEKMFDIKKQVIEEEKELKRCF